MTPKRLCLALLAYVAAACGGGNPVNIKGSGTTGPFCTIQLSGALTQTLDCSTMVAGLRTASPDSSTVSGGVQGTPAVAVNIRYQGAPATGVFYRSSDAGARGFVSASSGSQGWIATTAGMPGNPPPSGSWQIALNMATAGTPTASGTPYVLIGTIDATMTPTGGGTNLVVRITFCGQVSPC